MADTIPDIQVSSTEFEDLYTKISVTEGTALEVINKGSYTVYLQESETQPANDSVDGVPLTPLNLPFAVATITSGSGKVWIRSQERTCKVSVVDRS